MVAYIDSHIHLSDPEYQNDIPLILQQMKTLKIMACCVSVDTSTSISTLDLAKNTDLIFPFVGIHPEHADDDLDAFVSLVEDSHEQISGIGEIGLDPTFSDDNYTTQTKLFETQLELAEKFKKPISIHSRKSIETVFSVMTSYNTSHAILHWFDSSKKNLVRAIDMGFFISYSPVLLYANDKQVLFSKTDQSKVLLETDGPVRFSHCFETKITQPSFIPSLIFCGSKIMDISFDEMALNLEHNFKSYLNIDQI